MKLSYPLTVVLTRIAVDSAHALGIPIAVALADSEGDLVHFAHMDGVLPASRTIAINKAYTAAALRMPTDEVGRLARPGEALYGIQHSLEGKAVLFGGGEPLRVDGRVLGALGISGGTVAQDMDICRKVRADWERMLDLARSLGILLPASLTLALSQQQQFGTHLMRALEGSVNLSACSRDIIMGAVWLWLLAEE
jgi:uncharacterized protein GlcG (DUF336 family)